MKKWQDLIDKRVAPERIARIRKEAQAAVDEMDAKAEQRRRRWVGALAWVFYMWFAGVALAWAAWKIFR